MDIDPNSQRDSNLLTAVKIHVDELIEGVVSKNNVSAKQLEERVANRIASIKKQIAQIIQEHNVSFTEENKALQSKVIELGKNFGDAVSQVETALVKRISTLESKSEFNDKIANELVKDAQAKIDNLAKIAQKEITRVFSEAFDTFSTHQKSAEQAVTTLKASCLAELQETKEAVNSFKDSTAQNLDKLTSDTRDQIEKVFKEIRDEFTSDKDNHRRDFEQLKASADDSLKATEQAVSDIKNNTTQGLDKLTSDTRDQISETIRQVQNEFAADKENGRKDFEQLKTFAIQDLEDFRSKCALDINTFKEHVSSNLNDLNTTVENAVGQVNDSIEKMNSLMEAEKSKLLASIEIGITGATTAATEIFNDTSTKLKSYVDIVTSASIEEQNQNFSKLETGLNEVIKNASSDYKKQVEEIKTASLELRSKDLAEYSEGIKRIAELELRARNIIKEFETIKLDAKTLPPPSVWRQTTIPEIGKVYQYRNGLWMWVGLEEEFEPGVPGEDTRWRCVVNAICDREIEVVEDHIEYIDVYSDGTKDVIKVPVFHVRGIYDENAEYNQYALVVSNSVVWCLIAENAKGVEPGTSDIWQAWSVRGAKGGRGKAAPKLDKIVLEGNFLLFKYEDNDTYTVDISKALPQLVQSPGMEDGDYPTIERFCGPYFDDVEYRRGDIVRYSNAIWVSLKDNKGVQPAATIGSDDWALFIGVPTGSLSGSVGGDFQPLENSLYVVVADRNNIPSQQLVDGLMAFQTIDQRTYQYFNGQWFPFQSSGSSGSGLYIVAEDKDSVPGASRVVGLMVFQTSDKKTYQWFNNTWTELAVPPTNTPNPLYIVASNRLAVPAPQLVNGLMVFQTEDQRTYQYYSGSWREIATGSSASPLYIVANNRTSVPAGSLVNGLMVFQTTDRKTYQYFNGAWFELAPPAPPSLYYVLANRSSVPSGDLINGLMVFQTDDNKTYQYNGEVWQEVVVGSISSLYVVAASRNDIAVENRVNGLMVFQTNDQKTYQYYNGTWTELAVPPPSGVTLYITATDRNNVPVGQRVNGLMVFQTSDQKTYQFYNGDWIDFTPIAPEPGTPNLYLKVTDDAARNALAAEVKVEGLLVYQTADNKTYLYEDSAFRPVILPNAADFYVVVTNDAARNALPVETKREGLLVYQTGDDKLYLYENGAFRAVHWPTAPTVLPTQLYRTVADATARDALPSDQKVEGLLVYQTSTDTHFLYENGSFRSVHLPISAPEAETPDFYMVVADITARDALPVEVKREGLLVYQTGDNKLYLYEEGSFREVYWPTAAPVEAPPLYRTVTNAAARDALPVDQKVEGLIVYQTADNKSFLFEDGAFRSVDVPSEPTYYVTVLNSTARDALPVEFKREGLLVYQTSDNLTFLFEDGAFRPVHLLTSAPPTPLYVVVANSTARDALPSASKVEGLLVYQTSDDKHYMFENGAFRSVYVPFVPPWTLVVADDAARAAMSATLVRDGVIVYQTTDKKTWRREGTTWVQIRYFDEVPQLPVLYRSVTNEAARNAITGAEGLIVYQTEDNRVFQFEEGFWKEIAFNVGLTIDTPVYPNDPYNPETLVSLRTVINSSLQLIESKANKTEFTALESLVNSLLLAIVENQQVIAQLKTEIDVIKDFINLEPIRREPTAPDPDLVAETTVTLTLVQTAAGDTELAVADDDQATHPTIDLIDGEAHKFKLVFGSGINQASFSDPAPTVLRTP